MQSKTLRQLLSASFALVVVALLVVASPVQAVQMKIQAPTSGQQGNKIPLTLGVNLEEGDRLPLERFYLSVTNEKGIKKTCIFDLEGNPIDGCKNFRIELQRNLAVPLGYGYGYGPLLPGKETEIKFKVFWDSTNNDAGTYTFQLFTGGNGQEYRSEKTNVLLKKKEKKECTEALEKRGECKRENPKEEKPKEKEEKEKKEKETRSEFPGNSGQAHNNGKGQDDVIFANGPKNK